MTPEQQNVVRCQYALTDAREQLEKAEDLLREAGCDHPEAYLIESSWEHDNGYGRQTRYRTWICGLCRYRKQTFEKPKS